MSENDHGAAAARTRERRYSARFLLTFSITALSGLLTWAIPGHAAWQQWTWLLHTLAGFWLFAVLALFVYRHLRIAQGFRRPAQSLLGWISLLTLLVVLFSGATTGILGRYEAQAWVMDVHIAAGLLVLAPLLAHLLLRRLLAGHGSRPSIFSQVLDRRLGAALMKTTLTSVLLVAALSLGYDMRESGFRDIASVPFSAGEFGEGIFLPSQAQTSTGGFLDARRIGRSEKCGRCHRQITDEWRSSMHGRSASDPFFQKNLHAMAGKKGIEATRYCGGCHIPVGLLSGELSPGGRLGSGMHIREGVSCMACHGIRAVVSLEGVGSYLYGPELPYLFSDSDGWLQTELHDYLLKINPEQHRRDMARDVLYQPEGCATCHEQYIDRDLNDWGWIKLQSQYQAWVKGPFSKHSDRNHASDRVYRCQDCHFPLVKGEDPSADRADLIRSHRTPAANTAVPHVLGDRAQLETVIRFLRDKRISLTLQVAGPRAERPAAGGEIRLNVGVSSNRIGHYFPAGTVDINEPWLELVVKDADGKSVYASGLIGPDNHVDPEARFYFSRLVNRDGKHVWRHDLFNAVGESHVNLLHPGRADIQTFRIRIPEGAKGPLQAHARLRYRKFNQRYAAWALDDKDIRLPIVDMAEARLSIALQASR